MKRPLLSEGESERSWQSRREQGCCSPLHDSVIAKKIIERISKFREVVLALLVLVEWRGWRGDRHSTCLSNGLLVISCGWSLL